jgi:hypothetical protein
MPRVEKFMNLDDRSYDMMKKIAATSVVVLSSLATSIAYREDQGKRLGEKNSVTNVGLSVIHDR